MAPQTQSSNFDDEYESNDTEDSTRRRVKDSSDMKNASFVKKFKQQSLPGWQPIFSARYTFPWMFVAAIVFIPLGVLLYVNSNNLKEIKIDYTHCMSVDNPSETCAELIRSPTTYNLPCRCNIEFSVEEPLEGDVYMYYGLTNFHQNHRLYVKSRDDNQLLGKIGTAENPETPKKDCEPLDKDANGKIIFPCGAIANSMFNDTLRILKDGTWVEVPLIKTGIAWDTDKDYKFKNPPQFKDRNDPIWEKFTSPIGWSRTIWDLDPDNEENNGVQNEDFIIWMRTAALPNFRKLYRKIDTTKDDYIDGLPAGKYLLRVDYRFEVASFGGTKSMILATTSSLLGGKNSFLGISYLTVGSMCILLGVLCFVIHIQLKESIALYKFSKMDDGPQKRVLLNRRKFKAFRFLPYRKLTVAKTLLFLLLVIIAILVLMLTT